MRRTRVCSGNPGEPAWERVHCRITRDYLTKEILEDIEIDHDKDGHHQWVYDLPGRTGKTDIETEFWYDPSPEREGDIESRAAEGPKKMLQQADPELKKPSEKEAPEKDLLAPSSPEEEVPPGQPDPKIDEIKHAQMQVHEIEVLPAALDIDAAVEMALQTDLQNLKEAGVALFDASGGDENKAVELMFQMHAEHVAQQAAQAAQQGLVRASS